MSSVVDILQNSSSPKEAVGALLEQSTEAKEDLKEFVRNGIPISLERVDTGTIEGQEFDTYELVLNEREVELFFQWRVGDQSWYVSNSSDKGGRWEPIDDSELLDDRNWY